MTNRILFVLLIAAVALACGSESPESSGSGGMATETSTVKSVEAGTTEVPTDPRAIGEKAPDFALTNHRDEGVTLSEAQGQPVVLAFYRGHW